MKSINKKLVGFALATLMVGSVSYAQSADTLSKAKTAGFIVLGVKENTIPMTYRVGSGYTGMQTELCEKFVASALPGVKVRYMSVTAQNRIPLLQNGTVDIVCDAATNTEARAEQVAFSYTDYVSLVRYAVKKESGIKAVEDLKGKTVATSVGTTVVQNLRALNSSKNLDMNLVLTKDHAEGFLLLQSGRADAYVMDDNTLAGNIANMAKPELYEIVGSPLSTEPLALMVRKDDPEIKNALNTYVAASMKSGDMEKLYNRWFMSPIPPRNTAINLPMSSATRAAYEQPNDRSAESYVAK
ncbi:amino acid ABC transporter substrate-binding protein [Achromobacter xylosoxidans]|uniref:amino acid ABC transporter substrate-binding protein n=1 Tax=Alcaligenes xylosoxydans xylosoxydans TaxID=85698 RepID=UPI0022B8818A|nr:amino acid ABC transporter substrate-binding protein [Achromobacter xylosoxidans]MCZ8438257.1 amino acid ABC transporter substrate-binding protein [Achromobacter xylosoxidans]